MPLIDIVYEGDLHTQAVHQPSGCMLATDAPRDNQGLGQSFSPTDLVATALGSCMLTIMGIVASRHALNLEGSRVSVEKFMVADPQRRIGRLKLCFELPKELGPDDRRLLERAALSCPVKQSLSPAVELEILFGT